MVTDLGCRVAMAHRRAGRHRAEQAEPHAGQEEDDHRDGAGAASRQPEVSHVPIIRLGPEDCKSPAFAGLVRRSFSGGGSHGCEAVGLHGRQQARWHRTGKFDRVTGAHTNSLEPIALVTTTLSSLFH